MGSEWRWQRLGQQLPHAGAQWCCAQGCSELGRQTGLGIQTPAGP